jgi:hypothetical protein
LAFITFCEWLRGLPAPHIGFNQKLVALANVANGQSGLTVCSLDRAAGKSVTGGFSPYLASTALRTQPFASSCSFFLLL